MRVLVIVAILLVGGASEARAERVSVAVAKGVVTVGKVTAKAAAPVVRVSWKGLRWLARHV